MATADGSLDGARLLQCLSSGDWVEATSVLEQMQPSIKSGNPPRNTVLLALRALRSPNQQLVSTACAVLQSYLDLKHSQSEIVASVFGDELGPELENGLSHNQGEVVTMCLSLLHSATAVPEGVNQLLGAHSHLLPSIWAAFQSDASGVATAAGRLLYQIAKTSTENGSTDGLALLTSPDMEAAIRTNETVALRGYELAVAVGALSPEAFAFLADSYAVSELLSAIASDDILVQLTVLQVVEQFGQNASGYQKLADDGVIVSMLNTATDPSTMAMVAMPLLRLVASILKTHASGLESFGSALADAVTAFFNADSDEHEETAIDCCGIVCDGSVTGLKWLLANESLLKSTLDYLDSANVEHRALAFHSLERMFTSTPDEHTQTIKELLDSPVFTEPIPTTALRALGRGSIPLRLAIFKCLAAIAALPFGPDVLMPSALPVFLANRDTDSEASVLRAKYDVVLALLSTRESGVELAVSTPAVLDSWALLERFAEYGAFGEPNSGSVQVGRASGGA